MKKSGRRPNNGIYTGRSTISLIPPSAHLKVTNRLDEQKYLVK